MSRTTHGQPRRLGAKLGSLRRTLGLTLTSMYEALEKEVPEGTILYRGYISRYEAGSRIPSLFVLLAYSRVGGVSMETLTDDRMDLP